MTTYNLTINADAYNGGSAADTFTGPWGGNDVLRGYGGNDSFKFQSGQYGLANGGSGQDKMHLVGAGYTQLDEKLKIVSVESLKIDATNLYATVDQLDSFTKFDINNSSNQFAFFLKGNGGTLDFSSSYTEPQKLTVEAEQADSAVKLTGSAKNDTFYGSDYADTLNGFKGNDLIYGYAGNDKINGGLGKDHLYGDDGKDAFIFDTNLGPNNVDRIGDFRYKDDSIKLDRDIFEWDGQQGSKIKASEFKVISNGQQIDANDHIIYNKDTGKVFYDADGKGGQAMVHFATLDNYSGDIPTLTYHDIFLV